jgi:hypothetical protein
VFRYAKRARPLGTPIERPLAGFSATPRPPEPMFWSLVRPDRILPPITKSAAETTSLEAGELAVRMIKAESGCQQLGNASRISTTPARLPSPRISQHSSSNSKHRNGIISRNI